MRYNFADEEIVPVRQLEDRIYQGDQGLGIAISPDEKWLIYARADERSSDIMMVDTR